MKIDIDKKIAKRLQQRVDKTDEFKDVEEYVNYLLAQVSEKLDEEAGEAEPEMSKKDEEKVKERLKALGYMD